MSNTALTSASCDSCWLSARKRHSTKRVQGLENIIVTNKSQLFDMVSNEIFQSVQSQSIVSMTTVMHTYNTLALSVSLIFELWRQHWINSGRLKLEKCIICVMAGYLLWYPCLVNILHRKHKLKSMHETRWWIKNNLWIVLCSLTFTWAMHIFIQ